MNKENQPIEIRPDVVPPQSRIGSIFELIAQDRRIMMLPSSDNLDKTSDTDTNNNELPDSLLDNSKSTDNTTLTDQD